MYDRLHGKEFICEGKALTRNLKICQSYNLWNFRCVGKLVFLSVLSMNPVCRVCELVSMASFTRMAFSFFLYAKRFHHFD